jgi:hypothetical protein
MDRTISRRSFCLASLGVMLSPYLSTMARSAASGPGEWNLPGPTPHLIAHCVPWFSVRESATDSTLTWRHWKGDYGPAKHDPNNRRPDGLRDIASVYYPLIGPYSQWSPNVIRYHLETAKAAGIQGFFLDWNGQGDFTDLRVPQFLDEAQRLGMKIGICYEEKITFDWRQPKTRAEALQLIKSDLQYIQSRYMGHPAYLRRNGLPFLFQFNGWGQGALGPKYLTPEEYVQVLGTLPHPIVLGRQGLDPAYSTSAQSRYLWFTFNPHELLSFGPDARKMIDAGQLQFFMHMMSPGFNDTGVWGWGGGPRVVDRKGLSTLRSTFDHAFDNGPELIQIVTWNDFNEGTVIEPTRENGFQYLDAIATWWAERKGAKADLNAIRKPFLDYAHHCSPQQKAELPSDYEPYLDKRSLAVQEPHYLDQLATRQ